MRVLALDDCYSAGSEEEGCPDLEAEFGGKEGEKMEFCWCWNRRDRG